MIEPGISGEQFEKSIDGLPQELRIMWKKSLRQFRKTNAPENWKGLTQIRGLEDFTGLRTSAQMAYLDDVRWLIAGLDPDKFSERVPAGMEVVKMGAIDVSQTVSDAEKMAHQEIPLGTPTEEVWDSRFKESARHAKNITIVDRYCITELIRFPASGLRKFIINCDRDALRLTVRVLSRVPDDIAEHLVEEKIKQSLPTLARGGVQHIEIHLLPDSLMQRRAHGRYVRFGTDYLFSIDTGINVLGGQKVFADCAFNMMPMGSDIKKKELTMLSHARKYPSVFVSA